MYYQIVLSNKTHINVKTSEGCFKSIACWSLKIDRSGRGGGLSRYSRHQPPWVGVFRVSRCWERSHVIGWGVKIFSKKCHVIGWCQNFVSHFSPKMSRYWSVFWKSWGGLLSKCHIIESDVTLLGWVQWVAEFFRRNCHVIGGVWNFCPIFAKNLRLMVGVKIFVPFLPKMSRYWSVFENFGVWHLGTRYGWVGSVISDLIWGKIH